MVDMLDEAEMGEGKGGSACAVKGVMQLWKEWCSCEEEKGNK